MIVLGFLYTALTLLAFGLGWRARRKPGARWMIAFLGLDGVANVAGLWAWHNHEQNQWAANLGTVAAAGALLPALAAWSLQPLDRLFRWGALALVVAQIAYFFFHTLGATDAVAYPIVCLVLVVAAGLVVLGLVRENAPLGSRMPFWMSAGVILAFSTDLLPWAFKARVAAQDLNLIRTLWTVRNGAWVLGTSCFAFGWSRA